MLTCLWDEDFECSRIYKYHINIMEVIEMFVFLKGTEKQQNRGERQELYNLKNSG